MFKIYPLNRLWPSLPGTRSRENAKLLPSFTVELASPSLLAWFVTYLGFRRRVMWDTLSGLLRSLFPAQL